MCKSCRSRKMLQNDYLVAKIGVDTAENEPRKESCGRGDVPPAAADSARRMHALWVCLEMSSSGTHPPVPIVGHLRGVDRRGAQGARRGAHGRSGRGSAPGARMLTSRELAKTANNRS